MKLQSTILFIVSVVSLAGCASGPASHFLMSAGGAGVGAAIGSLASDGNPAITALSAVAGAGLGEVVNQTQTKAASKEFTNGYNAGRADAVKAQYWMLQRQQRPQDDELLYYPIPVPAQQIDGVNYQPTTNYIALPK
ncbi:MAG TPA: hypothetical protein P5525_07535 [Candidatus Paceibacterota bacterium]|nr:hypothetical protein [Candidatus Paceibacterota bacterium]